MSAMHSSQGRDAVPSNKHISYGKVRPEREVATDASRKRTGALASRFLKGPIPMPPLWTASRIPGKALAMYLAIRHQADITGRSSVRMPASLLREFGIDKDAKSRSLRALESAGLILVRQIRGQSAQVELVNSGPGNSAGT